MKEIQTNQHRKKSFEEEETNQSRRLFLFLYEWMKPRKETQQEKLFEKKYEKKYNHAQFNLQVKGGKETEWQKEQEREREGGGVWLETIQ